MFHFWSVLNVLNAFRLWGLQCKCKLSCATEAGLLREVLYANGTEKKTSRTDRYSIVEVVDVARNIDKEKVSVSKMSCHVTRNKTLQDSAMRC